MVLTQINSLSMEVSRNVFKFEKENGRTYHGFRPGSKSSLYQQSVYENSHSLAYHFPNDPTETERLDFQFEIIKFCFSNRNYFAPLSSPKRILDIGTGTGQWAIEVCFFSFTPTAKSQLTKRLIDCRRVSICGSPGHRPFSYSTLLGARKCSILHRRCR